MKGSVPPPPSPPARELAAQLKSAVALHQQGNLGDAEKGYRSVLRLDPGNFVALQLLGTIAAQRNDPRLAIEFFNRALAIKPDYADAHNNRGNALWALNRLDEAVASYDRALQIEPRYADAHNNRGNCLKELGRVEQALASYDRALDIDADHAEAHANRGNALKELNRLDEALASYDCALRIKPGYAETHYSRGNALTLLRRYEEALASYDRALSIKPENAEAQRNRGNALLALGWREEALASLDRSLEIKPNQAEAHNCRGNALMALGRLDEALASYDRALDVKPDLAEAHNNRGLVLQHMKRLDEARVSYGRALRIDPDQEFLRGALLHAKMHLCDWDGYDVEVDALLRGIGQGRPATPPFALLAITSDPACQRRAAEIWVGHKHPQSDELGGMPKRARGQKIRVGYFSADFHEHATAYLMAELFERHDRSRFELVALSFGPEKNDGMRKRVRAAFDKFLDLRQQSDRDIAALARQLGIDIAVDLKGYTRDSRAGIFCRRAAPIQVGYLGYPGTTGAGYIDYLIADRVLVPQGLQQHYAEKIAYLPGSYQVNDTGRSIAESSCTRQQLGLPEAGFVFCCFNNSFKITPRLFDGWMRVLKRVDGSVLWLLEDNPTAAANLRTQAQRRGVKPERLIFAKRLPLAEHLARHRAADLFIDTTPCNAHTTASDALWAGLPLLTCSGQSFASRVAASLLTAIGLEELITATQEEYEALAIELATHPERLRSIKQKLGRNRLTTSLFDTRQFARHLESAYVEMVERYQSGLPAEHIHVDP